MRGREQELVEAAAGKLALVLSLEGKGRRRGGRAGQHGGCVVGGHDKFVGGRGGLVGQREAGAQALEIVVAQVVKGAQQVLEVSCVPGREVRYDDNLKSHWRLASDENSKQVETLNLTEATDKYVLGIMMRRDGLTSKKITAFMVAIDAKTGKKILDLPVETSSTEQLSLSSFTFDAAKREFVAVGEYYKSDDKPFVNKSLGFFVKRFNEAGKAVATKNYGWQKEVMARMPAEAKPSLENNYVNYVHSIVKGANGNMYVVAEQFKIVLDGWGMLGGNSSTSMMKGKIGNLLVYELDPQAALTSVKFYPKYPSDASLPAGVGFMGAGLLGNVMKAQGDFDYQFLQKNDANSQFNVVYINSDKQKGEATKKIVGNIGFGDTGKYAFDKIDLTSGSSFSYVYPAKPGYVMIADYYRKKSQLGMKLVKLNI